MVLDDLLGVLILLSLLPSVIVVVDDVSDDDREFEDVDDNDGASTKLAEAVTGEPAPGFSFFPFLPK